MAVIEVNEKNFEAEVLKSEIPVLVDFWAEWCGPCKMIAPLVDEISNELDGKLKVAKVDVDQAQELAGKFTLQPNSYSAILTVRLIFDANQDRPASRNHQWLRLRVLIF